MARVERLKRGLSSSQSPPIPERYRYPRVSASPQASSRGASAGGAGWPVSFTLGACGVPRQQGRQSSRSPPPRAASFARPRGRSNSPAGGYGGPVAATRGDSVGRLSPPPPPRPSFSFADDEASAAAASGSPFAAAHAREDAASRGRRGMSPLPPEAPGAARRLTGASSPDRYCR